MPRSTADILNHADELADAFENLDPEEGLNRVTGLGELYLAVQDRAASERRLRKAVSAARDEGTSWAFIGRVLGTSGEAARQRFGATVPAKKAATAKGARAAPTKAAPAKKAAKKSDDGVIPNRARKRSTRKPPVGSMEPPG